jgi:hypothetical protein
MNDKVSEQLDKVLAMVDSSHEGEAIVAIRKARQMLNRDGLSFSDLARAATQNKPRVNLPFSVFSAHQVQLETEIATLRQKYFDLQDERQNQETQLDYWKRRAGELEQSLSLSNAQALQWRELARETVEKLWDLGQSAQMDEFAIDEPAKTAQKTA